MGFVYILSSMSGTMCTRKGLQLHLEYCFHWLLLCFFLIILTILKPALCNKKATIIPSISSLQLLCRLTMSNFSQLKSFLVILISGESFTHISMGFHVDRVTLDESRS